MPTADQSVRLFLCARCRIQVYAEELRHHISPLLRILDEAHRRSAREDLARNYLPDWGSKVERQPGDHAFVGGNRIQVVDIKLYLVMRWLIRKMR